MTFHLCAPLRFLMLAWITNSCDVYAGFDGCALVLHTLFAPRDSGGGICSYVTNPGSAIVAPPLFLGTLRAVCARHVEPHLPAVSLRLSVFMFLFLSQALFAAGSGSLAAMQAMPSEDDFPIAVSSSLETRLSVEFNTTLNDALEGGRLYRNRLLEAMDDLPDQTLSSNESYVTTGARTLLYR